MEFFLNRIQSNLTTNNEDIALVIKSKKYTYSYLLKKIINIQSTLNFISKEKIIGIEALDNINTYAAILACWFSGKGFVPLHPEHPENRNQEIINQAGIKTVLCPSQEESKLINSKISCTIINNTSINANLKYIKTVSNQTACILFTSGSTGVPKGVPMSFSNINCTLDSFFALGYGLNKDDRFLQMFELTFDMSLLSYLPAFILGASVYTVGNNKIKYLEALNVLQKQKISFAAMVPSTLVLMQPYFSRIKLLDLRYSLLGGEAFYENLAKQWSLVAPNSEIVNISGPTEVTMACMGYNLDKGFKHNKVHNGILAFGFPWKNTLAIIVDEDLNLLQPMEIGELSFAGDHVMEGYLNQHELNRDVFFEKSINGEIQRFYRTGDMTYIDNDGCFYTCGRKDKQVKIQGFKVELEEIDQTALGFPNVSNSCSLVDKSSGLSEIVLFVESKNIEKEIIQQHIQKTLPYYMVPAKILILEQFPLNINGKVDRVSLKDKLRKNQ